jgi:hypothetical protein
VRAVERLGVAVAFTMSSEITHALMQQVTPFQTEISLHPQGFVLPIVNSVHDIATGKISRDAYVCLCRQERMVLVWGDTVPGIRKSSPGSVSPSPIGFDMLILISRSWYRYRDTITWARLGIAYPIAQSDSFVPADSAVNTYTTNSIYRWRCANISVPYFRAFDRGYTF